MSRPVLSLRSVARRGVRLMACALAGLTLAGCITVAGSGGNSGGFQDEGAVGTYTPQSFGSGK